MGETIKTYKERIDSNKMLDEVHVLIRGIEKAKNKAIDRNPSTREYITQIPNAGIFVYNKLNEFIKELASKSITGESVVYAALKKELSALAINDNFNDILGYENDERAKLDQLQTITKPTLWQRIKRFINQKFLNVYMTDEDFEIMDDYIKKRDNTRRELTNNIIERAEAINDIELDKNLVSQSLLHYLDIISSQNDFNLDVFKCEVTQELDKLGMPNITKEIDQKMDEQKKFMQRIKCESNDAQISDKSGNGREREDEDITK